MGRSPDISRGVVQDKIFEMNQLAFDPQRCTGVGEVLAFEEAGADGRASNPLVETGQGDGGVENRPHQGVHADF